MSDGSQPRTKKARWRESAAASWRVDSDGPEGGQTHMARDALLLRMAERGQASVRVYSWSCPWVTLGRYQHASEALLEDSRIPWASRPTGGRAVLHGHDITIGLAAPLSALGLNDQRGLRAVYRAAIAPIVAAIRSCGVPAVLGEAVKRDKGSLARSADCFLAVSSNDVVDERTGAKICGCAMRVTDRAVLVQGSLPVRPPLVDPSLVYQRPATLSLSQIDQAELVAAFQQILRA